MTTRRHLMLLTAVSAALVLTAIPVRARATLSVCASGCTYSNSHLQSAINAAVGGDVILVQEGYTYQGTFTLPYHRTPTSYVEIRTGVSATGTVLPSNRGTFPASGVRMTKALAATAKLAKFQSVTSNQPAIRTVNNLNPPSQYWRLKWIEGLPNAGASRGSGAIIELGTNTNANQPTSAHIPHHMDLEQVYIHGSETRGQFRCVTIHSSHTNVKNSTISDCWTPTGHEGQAIWLNGYETTVLLENNFISGGAEVIMQGGDPGPARPTAVTIAASGRTTTAATLSTVQDLYVGQGVGFLVNGLEQYAEIASCGTSTNDALCTSTNVTFTPALSGAPDSPGQARWGTRPRGLTLRRNQVTRPVEGKFAWIPTPTNLSVIASETGGTLGAGTHCLAVYARRQSVRNSYMRSTATGAVCATITGSTGSLIANWDAGTDIDNYYVYAGPVGSLTRRFTATAATFTDVGDAGTTEALPTSDGTRHAVKNTFELKNAREVLLEGNIFEHSWAQAQTGFVMTFTPANTYGSNPSTVLRDVEVRYNIIRGGGGGFQVTARDAYRKSAADRTDNHHASGLLTNLSIHNNLFYDLGTQWSRNLQWFIVSAGGSGGTAMYNTGARGPVNVTINHNTILQTTGNSFLNLNLGSRTIDQDANNFDFTNNIAIKLSHGLVGNLSCSSGNGCWTAYTTNGSDWQNNFVADVTCASYPGGCTETLTNTTATLMTYFVSPSTGNYRLTGSTPLDNAATDGTDIGADIATLESVMGGAVVPSSAPAPTMIEASPLPAATIGTRYTQPIPGADGKKPITGPGRDAARDLS